MKVQGEFTFDAPRPRVWAALLDPAVLRRCIPGCQRLDPTGHNTYAMTASIGVAMVRGRFSGTVSVRDALEPHSLVLAGEGKGGPGFLRGEARVSLEEAGKTTLARVDGDVAVGGLLARLGQRALDPVARKLLSHFFECLGRSCAERG